MSEVRNILGEIRSAVKTMNGEIQKVSPRVLGLMARGTKRRKQITGVLRGVGSAALNVKRNEAAAKTYRGMASAAKTSSKRRKFLALARKAEKTVRTGRKARIGSAAAGVGAVAYGAGRRRGRRQGDEYEGEEEYARGEGRGVGGPRQGLGPVAYCTCPKCDYKVKHTPNKPCLDMTCPKCGAKLVGTEKKPKEAAKEEFSNHISEPLRNAKFAAEVFQDRAKRVEKILKTIES